MRKTKRCASGAGALVIGALVTSGGCADPCNDDGLDQKHCPEEGASGDTGGSGAGDGGTGTGTGPDDTPGTGSGGAEECPDLDVVLTPQTPTIQLVVDQSGSMDEDFGGVTKWDAVRDTLVDPSDGIVARLQSEIRFGLSRYSSGMECPEVREMLPQLDAADEIALEMMDMPGGQTPTGESFEVILDTFLMDTWDGDHFIVLATDGEPDICGLPEPMTDEEIDMVRGRAVSAVEAAFAEGIQTFVISVGDAVAEEHLQDLANAGIGNGPGDPDAPFYQALDQQALVDAFDEIISGLRECTLILDKPLKPELAPSCDVTINDSSIPYDDPDGWQLDGDMAIELQGAACTAIQEGIVVIGMTCTCEA